MLLWTDMQMLLSKFLYWLLNNRYLFCCSIIALHHWEKTCHNATIFYPTVEVSSGSISECCTTWVAINHCIDLKLYNTHTIVQYVCNVNATGYPDVSDWIAQSSGLNTCSSIVRCTLYMYTVYIAKTLGWDLTFPPVT